LSKCEICAKGRYGTDEQGSLSCEHETQCDKNVCPSYNIKSCEDKDGRAHCVCNDHIVGIQCRDCEKDWYGKNRDGVNTCQFTNKCLRDANGDKTIAPCFKPHINSNSCTDINGDFECECIGNFGGKYCSDCKKDMHGYDPVTLENTCQFSSKCALSDSCKRSNIQRCEDKNDGGYVSIQHLYMSFLKKSRISQNRRLTLDFRYEIKYCKNPFFFYPPGYAYN